MKYLSIGILALFIASCGGKNAKKDGEYSGESGATQKKDTSLSRILLKFAPKNFKNSTDLK